jgi:pyruvate,water dikinase
VALPPGFDPAGTVLVARSVDAGWIPTFALVAAVVVETGGDLSHGSILLRERGVPAVTNVRGVTRALATGDPVEVRAGAGVVELLRERRAAA